MTDLNEHENHCSDYSDFVCYSRGISKYDNEPVQLTVSDFAEFVHSISNDISPTKGLTYICAPMSFGPHDDQKKFSGDAHWRLASHAEIRRFIAFDFDKFSSPMVFEDLRDYFAEFSALLYTTASSTELAPRARAIVELDCVVDRKQGELLGAAIQKELETLFGIDSIDFDPSVYRSEQPIYTPVVGASSWISTGKAVNVASYLKNVAAKGNNSLNDDLTSHLGGFMFPTSALGPGERNTYLLAYVGHLRSKGLRESEILSLAQVENKLQMIPPLGDDEVADICNRYAKRTFESTSSFDYGAFGALSGDLLIPHSAPPKRTYVFADRVTPGTLCTFGGSGGVSKTMLMMQIAVAMACGKRLGDVQVAEGASLLLLGEEDDAERDRRFGGICAHMSADMQLVQERIKCFAASGVDMRLTQKQDGNPQETGLGDEIIQLAKHHASNAGVPVQLIVVDHARLVLGGDPNAADDVTQLTRVLTNIAKQTGAAVVLIAHSPKSVLSKEGDEINAADIAGSSAFVDNSRAAFMAYGMRKEEAKHHHIAEEDRSSYVRLSAVKANYAPSGGGYWFKRVVMANWEIAVLESVCLHSPAPFQRKSVTALRDRILEELRKKHGGVTARNLRDKSGTTGVLKASEAAVRREIEAMKEAGLVELRKPTAAERKQFKLLSTVRDVLVAL
jgi:hypothetical protein